MADVKRSKGSSPGDIWKDYPRDAKDTVQNIKSASEFMDIPIEDFLYYAIADLIVTDLKARKVLRLRAHKPTLIPMIMERLALLNYGKELLDGPIASEIKKHSR